MFDGKLAALKGGVGDRACLHEVAGGDGLADVGVVVARVEVGADQLGAEPGCNPDLHTRVALLVRAMLLPSARHGTAASQDF